MRGFQVFASLEEPLAPEPEAVLAVLLGAKRRWERASFGGHEAMLAAFDACDETHGRLTWHARMGLQRLCGGSSLADWADHPARIPEEFGALLDRAISILAPCPRPARRPGGWRVTRHLPLLSPEVALAESRPFVLRHPARHRLPAPFFARPCPLCARPVDPGAKCEHGIRKVVTPAQRRVKRGAR